jgi:hypothetical protein
MLIVRFDEDEKKGRSPQLGTVTNKKKETPLPQLAPLVFPQTNTLSHGMGKAFSSFRSLFVPPTPYWLVSMRQARPQSCTT